jgi:hypothetical protein
MYVCMCAYEQHCSRLVCGEWGLGVEKTLAEAMSFQRDQF